MYDNETPEVPTTATYLDRVMQHPCHVHGRVVGIPCWWQKPMDGWSLAAVCNGRAKIAGFHHSISNFALNRKNPNRGRK